MAIDSYRIAQWLLQWLEHYVMVNNPVTRLVRIFQFVLPAHFTHGSHLSSFHNSYSYYRPRRPSLGRPLYKDYQDYPLLLTWLSVFQMTPNVQKEIRSIRSVPISVIHANTGLVFPNVLLMSAQKAVCARKASGWRMEIVSNSVLVTCQLLSSILLAQTILFRGTASYGMGCSLFCSSNSIYQPS